MKLAADFRQAAREALRGKWPIAILIGLVAMLLGGSEKGGAEIKFNYDTSAGFSTTFNFAGQKIYSTGCGIDPKWSGLLIGGAIYLIVIALMAFFLRDEFPKADMDKVTRMCLIHDLGECFTGDIPAFDKTAQDESTEEALLYQWVASLSSPCREEMRALYDEMAALETQEAQIYKALDKLEAVISHNESDISTWEDHEYDLQLTYGEQNVAFSPYLTALRQAVRQESLDKIAREGDRRK